MTRIFFLRHAQTSWNLAGRIQGSADIDLTQEARNRLKALRLPSPWLGIPWYASPLKRAQETAQSLGASNKTLAPLLREMSWGQFEGMTLKEINLAIKNLGLDPDHGMDLLPPDGESPRMVRQRLQEWLCDIAVNQPSLVAVTHKGVIRAALSLATGWNMATPFTRNLDWNRPHCFSLASDGNLYLEQLNCRWENTSLIH